MLEKRREVFEEVSPKNSSKIKTSKKKKQQLEKMIA